MHKQSVKQSIESEQMRMSPTSSLLVVELQDSWLAVSGKHFSNIRTRSPYI